MFGGDLDYIEPFPNDSFLNAPTGGCWAGDLQPEFPTQAPTTTSNSPTFENTSKPFNNCPKDEKTDDVMEYESNFYDSNFGFPSTTDLYSTLPPNQTDCNDFSVFENSLDLECRSPSQSEEDSFSSFVDLEFNDAPKQEQEEEERMIQKILLEEESTNDEEDNSSTTTFAEDKSMLDSYSSTRAIAYTDKQKLLNNIQELKAMNPKNLQLVIDIVRENEPTSLMMSNGDVVFDLSLLKDSTVLKIKDFVDKRFIKEKNPFDLSLYNSECTTGFDNIMINNDFFPSSDSEEESKPLSFFPSNTAARFYTGPPVQILSPQKAVDISNVLKTACNCCHSSKKTSTCSHSSKKRKVPDTKEPFVLHDTSLFDYSTDIMANDIDSRPTKKIKTMRSSTTSFKKLNNNVTSSNNKANNKKSNKKPKPMTLNIRIYDLRNSKVEGVGFQCPECSKVFRDSSNLLKHIRCHTQEKPYKCKFCGKAFAHSSTLKGHENIHTGEKPFTCDHPGCNKSFPNSSNLSRHKRVHTGEKPYPCRYCGKRFNQSSNRNQHEKTHAKK